MPEPRVRDEHGLRRVGEVDEILQEHMSSFKADPKSRLYPSRFQFDYIILSDLRHAITRHAGELRGRVLDYGCGVKPYRALFRQAAEYLGADFPSNPHADMPLNDGGQLPENADRFDAVVSFQVLEHVPTVNVYLSECRRVLEKTKGKLLLTTHGIWDYHPGPRDLYRWTHDGLLHTIQGFGFQTCVVEPVTTGHRSLLQIITCRIERRWVAPRRLKALVYWVMNSLADCFKEDCEKEHRLVDFPICYLYLGKYGGVSR